MRPFVLPCLAVGFVACLAYALHRRSTRRNLVWQTYKAQEKVRAAGYKQDRERRIPVGHPDSSYRVGLSVAHRDAFEEIAEAEDPRRNAGLSILDREDGAQ